MTMRLKEKIVILAASILLSLAGFSLIAGPSVDMVKLGKKAGYEMIASYLEKAEAEHVGH
jgi:hypothetical protein